MGFTLDKVVPWGRSYDEYVSMFGLSGADLGLRILGCGDGPAGFNATLTKRGGRVVSVDPLYAFDAEQISGRISETYETVMSQLRKNRSDFVWGVIPTVEQLGMLRMAAMETFLADFDAGKLAGRYIPGELPALPFAAGEFDLALSSHFLFLYSGHLSAQFHLQALRKMLRVAREVRVFPLVTLDNTLSLHLKFVREQLASLGFNVEVRRVPYEFQRGGNEMLAIRYIQEKKLIKFNLTICWRSSSRAAFRSFSMNMHRCGRWRMQSKTCRLRALGLSRPWHSEPETAGLSSPHSVGPEE
jgi:hypothetical protein